MKPRPSGIGPLRTLPKGLASYLPVALIAMGMTPILLNFLASYPTGWDPAEYVWCLKDNYLPHSPYIVFFLLGKCFDLFFRPPLALSVLSLVSGLCSLFAYYSINLRLFGAATEANEREKDGRESVDPRKPAALSTSLFAFSYLFVVQSTTQEVYALQTAVVLVSFAALLARAPWSALLGGALFGCAVATHNSSAFFAPAALWAIWMSGTEGRGRKIGRWLAAAFVVTGAFALLTLILLPAPSDGGRLREWAGYLRGISPGLNWTSIATSEFLFNSMMGMIERVFAVGVPPYQPLWIPSDLGFNAAHLIVGIAGLLLCIHRRLRVGYFWLLFGAPYLIYEFLLGSAQDMGVYLPFLLPSCSAFLVVAVGSIPAAQGAARWKHVRAVAQVLLVGCLMAPSLALIAKNWNTTRQTAVHHYSGVALMGIWMDRNLPADAFLIVHSGLGNPNELPYYSGRRPILVRGTEALILRDGGRFMPLNARAYEPIDDSALQNFIEAGTPVYSLSANPWIVSAGDDGAGQSIVWELEREVDLSATAADLPLRPSLREQVRGGSRPLYRASIRTSAPQSLESR